MHKSHIKLSLAKVLLRLVFTSVIFLLHVPTLMAMSSDEVLNEKHDEKNWKPELAESRQDVKVSKTVIEDIKTKEPFINIQQKKIWDFSKEDEEEFDDELNPDLQWLGALFSFLAMFVEAILWLLPLLVILYLYRYRDYCMNLIRGKGFKQDKTVIPETLFGLDMREKSLPDNIEKAATELWLEKKYREAVSLLYRGSLVALFKQYKFELAPGATEQDCIRQIELTEKSKDANEQETIDQSSLQNTHQRIAHFKQLTGVWIEIAYAHRLPSESVFSAVCDGWNQLFEKNGKSK